ncbi:MAG TPA: hypothetical protein PKI11_05785 [Candidatus Hydrogenedentes bacterium]|nr:hypothetical protein [Candidatus Hydrogenedentota bacterium]
MDAAPSRRLCAACAVAAFLCIAAAMFTHTVLARAPWFGEAPMNIAGWMTGGSTLMAKHWHHEGACAMRFAMVWEPDSIEQPYLGERTPYVSYPPGAILPLHLLALCRGREPTPSLAMALNLALHLVTALVLAATVALLLRRAAFSRWNAFVLALVPLSLYLYLPIAYHEHLMSYFADAAVLPLYALFIFLEMLRDRVERPWMRRSLAMIQGFVGALGLLTDWLFAFLAACVWLARLGRGRLGRGIFEPARNSLVYALPFVAVLALFIVQVIAIGGKDMIIERFLLRSGATPGHGLADGRNPLDYASLDTFLRFSLDTRFWNEHVPASFGRHGTPIIVFSFAAWAVLTLLTAFKTLLHRLRPRRGRSPDRATDTTEGLPRCGRSPDRTTDTTEGLQSSSPSPRANAAAGLLAAAFLYLVPCLLYYHVFKQHNNLLFHRYSTLKFALPLAALPLAILPAACWRLWFPAPAPQPFPIGKRGEWKLGPLAGRCAPVALLALAAAFLVAVTPERKALFFSDDDLRHVAAGKFIAANTTRNDIVFAPARPAWADMPQFRCYAMKRLHPASSVWDLYAFVRDIDGPWRIALFLDRADRLDRLPELRALGTLIRDRVFFQGALLLYVDKCIFASFCERIRVNTKHPNDRNRDGRLTLDELAPVIDAYLAGAYHDDPSAPSGYAAGPGPVALPHPGDYGPDVVDGQINLSELLRQTQLYNSGGYRFDATAQGRFAPHAPTETTGSIP